jgi:hypothetical protein
LDQPPRVARLDLASPAWSLAQASDQTSAIHICENYLCTVHPPFCRWQEQNAATGDIDFWYWLPYVLFLFFLHTNMHHFYCRD